MPVGEGPVTTSPAGGSSPGEPHGAKVLVLFGPPGSGKGTQAKLLIQCLGIPHISTGDMLREHITARDKVGLEVQVLMKSGRLAPDELVNCLVWERIMRPDCAKGFILDGYPRTISQSEVLRRQLESIGADHLVVHLNVDYNKLVARLTGRRQCATCGALYNLELKPPKEEGVCDIDGGPLVLREDDREEVIRARLEEYERETRPLLEHLAKSGSPLAELDGSTGTPHDLAERICTLVLNGNQG